MNDFFVKYNSLFEGGSLLLELKNIKIDFEKNCVSTVQDGSDYSFPLNTAEAFSLISKAMLRVGWDNKYVYSFSWLGRPIIQLPDDMIRIQELIYKVKPDVIIETGIAHGGSLIYYASILNAIGKGRVIGVDIDIRAHNRKAIESHNLFDYITLIEGSSTDTKVVKKVANLVDKNEVVLVFLDSNHSKDHVLKELDSYSSLVSVGSYIVAMDGIMKDLKGAERAKEDWSWNNPSCAAKEFVKNADNFIIDEPEIPFNEGSIVKQELTYWPNAYIKRIN